MAKGKKSIQSDKKEVKKYLIKTSFECGQCKNQCDAGLSYIELMKKSGAKGNGVVCKFV